ncbi:HU family DNA-binding protein [Thermodesulfobacteriota bacterium]
MTLTKADLIETIQSNNGLTLKQSTNLVETLMEIMKEALDPIIWTA